MVVMDLTDSSLAAIEDAFRSVAQKMNFVVVEFNGESIRVRVLIECFPKLSISAIVLWAIRVS